MSYLFSSYIPWASTAGHCHREARYSFGLSQHNQILNFHIVYSNHYYQNAELTENLLSVNSFQLFTLQAFTKGIPRKSEPGAILFSVFNILEDGVENVRTKRVQVNVQY